VRFVSPERQVVTKEERLAETEQCDRHACREEPDELSARDLLPQHFVVLTLDAYRANPARTTVALATGAAVVVLLVAPGSMVLVAMSLFAVGLVLRHLVITRGRSPEEPERSSDEEPATRTGLGRA
jgi:VIT1/CCC1 family predicted Fe2+/Mn2+ transporter